MSSHLPAPRPMRGLGPLLAAAALALALVGCGSDIVPPGSVETAPTTSPATSAAPGASFSPALTPTPTPSPTPSPTPTVTPQPTPTVVDGPDIVGPDIAHCPGTTKKGQAGSTGSQVSTNWSGYAIVTSRSVVTCVEAEWVQPTVKCHGKTHTSVSIWVGLGGFNQGNALEQIGTAIDCVAGSSLDYSWHESLPKERREIDTPVSVDPGDRVWAQVRWLGGSSYQLSLANLTSEDGFTVRDTNKGLHRTEGEWIAEAPATGCSPTCKILLMPDWGKITFGRIAVTVNGVRTTLKANGSTRVRVRLETNSGATRAVVTKTASDGSSFVVTWRHA